MAKHAIKIVVVFIFGVVAGGAGVWFFAGNGKPDASGVVGVIDRAGRLVDNVVNASSEIEGGINIITEISGELENRSREIASRIDRAAEISADVDSNIRRAYELNRRIGEIIRRLSEKSRAADEKKKDE